MYGLLGASVGFVVVVVTVVSIILCVKFCNCKRKSGISDGEDKWKEMREMAQLAEKKVKSRNLHSHCRTR